VVITDTTGAIEYVNPAFEQVTGYSSDEVLGRNPRSSRVVSRVPRSTPRCGRPHERELVHRDMTNRRKDGSLFQEESVVSAVRDEAGVITSYVGSIGT